MKFLLTLILFVSFLGSPLAQDIPDLAEKASASIVFLKMKNSQNELITGTGFFISPTHIVTNYHILVEAIEGTAKIVNKAKTYPIQGVVAKDPENDLAILQVANDGIKPLPLGDSDQMRVGMDVFTIGNPRDFEGSFSSGKISGRRIDGDKKRLQMTASISPGSSGSPMLNLKGEVIGVVYKYRPDGQNLNFAIPSNYVNELLNAIGHVTSLSQEQKNRYAKAYFHRGNSRFEAGFYMLALSDYNEAIKLKPDMVNAYINRAGVKLELIKIAEELAETKRFIELCLEALQDCNHALTLDPNANKTVYYNRARVKIWLWQYKEAILDLNIVIDDAPTFSRGYYFRGKAKSEMGKYDEAIHDYNHAILGKPDYVEAYYDRAEMKRFTKQYNTAIIDYKMAILLKPDVPDGYFRLGQCYDALGYLLLAKIEIETALKKAKEAGQTSKRFEDALHAIREKIKKQPQLE